MYRNIRQQIKTNGLTKTKKNINQQIQNLRDLQKKTKDFYDSLEIEHKIMDLEKVLKQLDKF